MNAGVVTVTAQSLFSPATVAQKRTTDSEVHFAVRRRQLLGGPPDMEDEDGPGPKHGPKGPKGGATPLPPETAYNSCP